MRRTDRSGITDEDLAVCRRFSHALAAGDLDAALADAHAEIELCTPRAILRGARGLRAFLAAKSLDHLERSVIVDDVVADGDHAVALARIELRWRHNGELADTQRVSALLHVRDGRIVSWRPALTAPPPRRPPNGDYPAGTIRGVG